MSLKSCDRNKVKEEVKKVNVIIRNIKTNNVTECNNLLYSAAYLVTERLGKLEKKAKSQAKNLSGSAEFKETSNKGSK